MTCKRCNADLADGHSICPNCGAALSNHTRRAISAQNAVRKKKKWARSTLLTFLSIILCIVVLTIAYRGFRSMKFKKDYEDLRQTYIDQRYDVLQLKVAQFVKDFGEDTPESEAAVAMLKQSRGVLSDEDVAALSDAVKEALNLVKEEALDNLRETAKESVLYIDGIRLTGPDPTGCYAVYVDWLNKSENIIQDVYFYFRAYDAGGAVIMSTANGTADAILKSAGPFGYTHETEPNKTNWNNVWKTDAVLDRVELTDVRILYADGSKLGLADVIGLITAETTIRLEVRK